MMTKYIKEEKEIYNKNIIGNGIIFKSRLYPYLNYIYNLFVIFTFVIHIFLNNISNMYSYIFKYLYLNIDNTKIKDNNNNKKYNNIIVEKKDSNNIINCFYSSIIKIYLNNSKLLMNEIKNVKNNLYIINKALKRISFDKNKYKRAFIYNFILFLFIINLKELKATQEINVTVIGTGQQKILNNVYFHDRPSQLLVNGITQSSANYYVYNLTQNINIITIRWDYNLTTCNSMFYKLDNIIDFDFSNFDTSQVINMDAMFRNMKSLKILDLRHFNTSSVSSMANMFSGCTSLVSLNLNNFNTSLVTNFNNMFDSCNKLIYLNLNSFFIKSDATLDSILSGTSSNLLICYDSDKAHKLTLYLNSCEIFALKIQNYLLIA